jgi:membrane-associated phospholipid phosphatase
MRDLLLNLLIDCRHMLSDARVEARRLRWWWGAAAVLVLLVALFVTLPHDREWVRIIASDRRRTPVLWARWFSHYGDFIGTLALAAVLGLVARFGKRPNWRRAALAVVLGAGLAGLAANLGRFTVGRPRPSANLPDGAYGPTVDWHYHGFPSAHAATAMGTAGALVVALPAVGVPVLVAASGVVWSRMHRRRHHPTDVMVGSLIGLFFGLSLGLAARR